MKLQLSTIQLLIIRQTALKRDKPQYSKNQHYKK